MSQPEQPGALPPKPKPPHTAVGIALIVIGLLILIPSGLCSGILGIGALVGFVMHPENAGDFSDTFGMVLVVGGIPAGIGLAIAYAGWSMRRRD